jgi:hypothetical protein
MRLSGVIRSYQEISGDIRSYQELSGVVVPTDKLSTTRARRFPVGFP